MHARINKHIFMINVLWRFQSLNLNQSFWGGFDGYIVCYGIWRLLKHNKQKKYSVKFIFEITIQFCNNFAIVVEAKYFVFHSYFKAILLYFNVHRPKFPFSFPREYIQKCFCFHLQKGQMNSNLVWIILRLKLSLFFLFSSRQFLQSS